MTIAIGTLAPDKQSKPISTVTAQVPRAAQSHRTQKQQGGHQLPSAGLSAFPFWLEHISWLLVRVLVALCERVSLPYCIRRTLDGCFQIREQACLLCRCHQQQSSCSFLNADGLFFFLFHPC